MYLELVFYSVWESVNLWVNIDGREGNFMVINLLSLQIKVRILRQSVLLKGLVHYQLRQRMMQTQNDLSCSSAKKLQLSFESVKKEYDNYYILLSFPILQSVVGRCK